MKQFLKKLIGKRKKQKTKLFDVPKGIIRKERGSFMGVPYTMCYTIPAADGQPVGAAGSFLSARLRADVEIMEILKMYLYFTDRPGLTISKIESWLNDNCRDEFKILPMPTFQGDYYELYIKSVFFKDEDDAMAFKLAWS